MPEAQYDAIAESFSGSDRRAKLRSHLVEPQVMAALGDVSGKDILDVGCGDGAVGRVVKRAGARRVVGVDLSPEFIRIAREAEAHEPLGIEYHVHSVVELPRLGAFDAAIAIFLLNHAETRQDLQRMCASIRDSLAPGGLLVAVTNFFEETEFFTRGPNLTKYGITFHLPDRLQDGDRITMEMHTENPFSIEFTHWSSATYEQTLREAGFENLTITPLAPSADAIAEFGPDHWRDLIDHPGGHVLRANYPAAAPS